MSNHGHSTCSVERNKRKRHSLDECLKDSDA